MSSNLPDAPANSVVVDPNDANTVYVALDTGVYVTTGITTCATANCWSVYGTSLPNAPVVALSAASAMPTGDGRTGELRASTYGRGLWQIPLLTAATAAQPSMSLTPATLTYGAQAVATASAPQTITVTNTGYAPLVVSQVAVTGDFNETDSCTAAPVAVGMTCAIQIRFLPTATGSRSGLITVYGNVAGGQATASLSGTGLPAAAIVLTPLILNFPSTTINSTSPVQNITISNTSSAALNLQSANVVGGDFKITVNTCGPSLGPGVGCTVGIAFTPSASGNRTSTFTVTDDAGTQTASLSGVGTSPPTDSLSPLALTFGPQQVNTISTAQQITLTNAGDQPLTLIDGPDHQRRLLGGQCMRQLPEPALYLFDQRRIRAEERRRHQRLAGRLRSIPHPNHPVEWDGSSPTGSFTRPFLDRRLFSHWRRRPVTCADGHLDEQPQYSTYSAKRCGHGRLRALTRRQYLRHHSRGRCCVHHAASLRAEHRRPT